MVDFISSHFKSAVCLPSSPGLCHKLTPKTLKVKRHDGDNLSSNKKIHQYVPFGKEEGNKKKDKTWFTRE
jgi:hypothetical protein